MPAELEIRGTADFRRTAAALKAASNGKLVREMSKRMRVAAKPAVEDARRSVQALASTGGRGGGGQARREHAVSRSRRRTERVKAKAFAGRGLRATIGRALTTKVSTSARRAGVSIQVNKRALPASQRTLPTHMNAGRWRHPVFGRKAQWVSQSTTPTGWFDRPMRAHGPRIRDRAVAVIDDINKQIVR